MQRIGFGMDKQTYDRIEQYMLGLMTDGAHDEQHIYRVLYAALEIASDYCEKADEEEYDGGGNCAECAETVIDYDILIAACLLHDIGRRKQFEDPSCDHAEEGAGLAYTYLLDTGWPEEKASHVRDCIYTHRYRSNNEPRTREAKILFDADKLDVTGALGIARTLAYKGIVNEPIYTADGKGNVLDGSNDNEYSFFREYNWKLKNVYGKFYTRKAEQMAENRRDAATTFYRNLLDEVKDIHQTGRERIGRIFEK